MKNAVLQKENDCTLIYQVSSKLVWENASTGCYVWMNLLDLRKAFFLHMKDEQIEVLIDWFDELKSK